ncbi:hypothetical protein ASPACDRAFT_38076 [Aspergillus aculeatus ATCC 16872]|uniref:Ubiquitin-like domain-containing protein n=1 Tax=Aspergillus aculeatus (strain ATCC 16872 / CBS 172.66 / WB 5094) TaxID=690307 RepID=A0A1L9X7V2_ASPA1|nr:uncharacterized protein ASPACDRAFT_38076 [Aspergillus aculeatus ATCC 16872]OJK04517.1 hypothetical protein ASPACDRAFT_38076 [Aspergillus aculeatus ATCC 16872]
MASTTDIPSASSDSPESFTLHVLCPSLPPPNRYTIQDVSPSTTVADLKARLAGAIPSQPSPDSQRLIYRGKPLLNDAAALRDVLEPPNATEYSIHLVLPPSPESSAPRNLSSSGPQQPQFIPGSAIHLPSMTLRPEPPTPRAEPDRTGASEAEVGLALRPNIETIRRQIEMRDRGNLSGGTTAFSSSLSPALSAAQQQRPTWPDRSSSVSTTRQELPQTFSPETVAATGLSNTASLSSALVTEECLQILSRQVELAESQLNRGIAPPMNHIIRIRTHLLSILDEQCMNPLAERDGSMEGLLSRVFNIYTRAHQLRLSEAGFPRLQNTSASAAIAMSAPGPASLYLLSSPYGYQGLLSSPQGAEAMQATIERLRATHPPNRTPNQDTAPVPEIPPNANAAVLENVVRRAVLNQRGLDNNPNQNGQLGFARIMLRLWQFARLYFFCYMFTEPGTWLRVFFVTLAVLFVLSSETGVDQRLYQLFVAPVQQHLEGLVHLTPNEPAQAQGHGGQGAVGGGSGGGPTNGNPRTGVVGEMRHQLRRVERSVALFIASLVPGVGERQVAVRNAAEAAQRVREEEERRQREEAQQQQQQEQQEEQENHVDAAQSEGHTMIPQAAEN